VRANWYWEAKILTKKPAKRLKEGKKRALGERAVAKRRETPTGGKGVDLVKEKPLSSFRRKRKKGKEHPDGGYRRKGGGAKETRSQGETIKTTGRRKDQRKPPRQGKT